MAAEFVDIPAQGRRYHGSRPVYLGDVDGHDQLHLEALGRYLQDLATDDAYDSGLRELGGFWVVRRYDITISVVPRFRDELDLVTFCSGTGACWAERRTSVTRDGAPVAEAVALWVFADEEKGRPIALGEEFFRIYGEAAGGRKVSSRLSHPPPAGGGGSASVGAALPRPRLARPREQRAAPSRRSRTRSPARYLASVSHR